MTLEELRKVLHEEVVKALREEVRDILVEAVEIASRPSTTPTVPVQKSRTEPVEEKYKSNRGLGSILQETAEEMTHSDYASLMGNPVQRPDFDKIGGHEEDDMTTVDSFIGEGQLPSFVKNAKAILEASNQIDRERHGV